MPVTSAFQTDYLTTDRELLGTLKNLREHNQSGIKSQYRFSPTHLNVPNFTTRPTEPRTVAATGLSDEALDVLILKMLFQSGVLEGAQVAADLCLPFIVVEPRLTQLKRQTLVEVKGGSQIGPATYRYALTDQGSHKAKEALARNHYLGPCPVTLEQYTAHHRSQTGQQGVVGPNEVTAALKSLILSAEILECIGPAINSRKSLFLYGPPGNGKTSIAKAIGRQLLGDEVLIPYAIYADGQIIKVFDPETHQAVPDPVAGSEPADYDQRWVRCRPPVITAGGELTLQDLDLAYSDSAGYYEAPLQLKANGGMLLIDDFGRQPMPPKDLLNRWIVPLEERVDFLTFHTGKKITVPFATFIVFSTNLPPESLVDGAFLRRIRHKLGIDYPTGQEYYQIFQQTCQQRRLAFDKETFIHLVQTYYLAGGRPFQACHPRDLLDQLADFAHYQGVPVRMTKTLIDQAARSYFARFF